VYGNVQRLNLVLEPNSIDVNKLQGKLRFNDLAGIPARVLAWMLASLIKNARAD